MGRLLRLPVALFRPIRHEAWIYVFFPAAAAGGRLLAEPGQPWVEYAAEFGHVLAVVLCIGLPAHLVYAHFGERLLAPRFRWRELLIHAAIILPAVLIGTELAIRLIVFFARPGQVIDPVHVTHFRHAVWFGGPVGVGLVTAAFLSRWRYRERIAEVERREQEAQRAALRAQLEALQARIQPHFLFNCLNTVAGLIEEEPARAAVAVERVADLFRYTLDAAKGSVVPLEAELAVVRDYLELEGLRYGARLDAQVEVEARARHVPLPPLSLQPLVENAVQHGIASRREGGRLEVRGRLRDGRLELSVEDDGPGPGRSGHSGSGIALADLRRRLAFLYGERASIEQDVGPLGGFRVRIGLPVEGADGVEAGP